MRLIRPAAMVLVCLAAIFPALSSAPKRTARVPERLTLSEDLRILRSRGPAAAKDALAASWRKVSRLLREPIARLAAGGSIASGAAPATPATADVRAALGAPSRFNVRSDGAVHVSLLVSGLEEDERRALRASGLEATFESADHQWLEGWLPIGRVEDVARLEFVVHVRPTIRPLTSVGNVTSQGDSILEANQARSTFGVTGAGVNVGVISDSVDGLDSAVATGDLPGNVNVLKAGVGAGEGTAMLEIVHDLAPGAALAFYGPATSGDMVTGINQLVALGAHVIVDDLTFLDQPHFEEGAIAQAVNAAAAQGVVYVTSSGNFAASTNADRGHYEEDFLSGGPSSPFNDLHDFGGGTLVQSFNVLPGATATIAMQWADRFGQSGNDYDMYIIENDVTIVALSDDFQDGDDLPEEMVHLSNPDATPRSLTLVINRASGAPRRLEIYYAGGVTDVAFATPAGSIAGHANANGAITVGSIDAADTGNDDVEDFSSRGPCDLFFPTAVSIEKPEVVAIDGVAVSGAAGFPSPFFGTSAAAPHVAAVAALMLDEHPLLPPDEVRNQLQATAVDLGPAGFDFDSGAGRVNALAAVGAVQPTGAQPFVSGLVSDLDGDELTLSGVANDPDGDIAQAKVELLNSMLQSIASTPFFDVTFDGQANTGIDETVTGLSFFPTALKADLYLRDFGGNEVGPFRTDFSGAKPGGPVGVSAKYAKSSKTLKVTGSGLAGVCSFEINGAAAPKPAVLNKTGRVAKLKGKASLLGLQSGPNRVRVYCNGLHSNIMILNM